MDKDLIKKKIQRLPKTSEKKVLDYIDYLIAKKNKTATTSSKGFTFDWEGGLSDLKGDYTSVDLQHKAKKWR